MAILKSIRTSGGIRTLHGAGYPDRFQGIELKEGDRYFDNILQVTYEYKAGIWGVYTESVPTVKGDSAYDIWIQEGHAGTEADFLKYLQGRPGEMKIVHETSGSSIMIKRHEWQAPYSYCGKAPDGSAETDSVWTVTIIWVHADGSTTVFSFTNVKWSDRYTLLPPPDAPTGNAVQYFSEHQASIGNLQVTGTDIKWYDAATGGNLLNSGISLVDDTYYYASQTVNGLESTDRLAVLAHIVIPIPSPTGDTEQTVSVGATTDDLVIEVNDLVDGVHTGYPGVIQLFEYSIGGDVLAEYPGSLGFPAIPLVDGYTYYATQWIYGGESSTRLEILVHIV